MSFIEIVHGVAIWVYTKILKLSIVVHNILGFDSNTTINKT